MPQRSWIIHNYIMPEILDVRLACCVLHRKRLIAELRRLSSHERLEFIAENTDVIKTQIHEILNKENCGIIEIHDENGSTRMVVQKN